MKFVYGIEPDLCIVNSEILINFPKDIVLPKYFHTQLTHLSRSNVQLATNPATIIINSLLMIPVSNLPLLNMTQLNILELAKQGDANAISHLLNQYLQPQGITAKASYEHDCLKVMLESLEVPDQQGLAAFIFMEIIKLEVKSIRRVKVYRQQAKTFDPAWYQNFEIEKQVELPSSASAQSTCTNTQANSQKELSRNKVSEPEFRAALEECAYTARQAYRRTVEYAKHAESIFLQLNNEINVTIFQLLRNKDAEQFEFARLLKDIASEVEHLSQEGIEDLVSSLNTKRNNLEDFTVALFGRTKAGKSTIREALTRGDGRTIGKGSQRTTRHVREYYWQGLRLLDTPGIEAYQGEEDTAKANQVIDQSDIILFLTSDESVQPGEFNAMVRLQQVNKYFAVILNVKDNIEKAERLERFIKKPEKVFEQQRLSEHQNHIRTYVRENLAVENVDIVCIHAMAAFLSTKPEYAEYSQRLWEVSRVEEMYYLIAADIKNNGQKRRVSTFFDGTINFISENESKISVYQGLLKAQTNFMYEKNRDLEKIFDSWKQDGKLKIEGECATLYSAIKQWVSYFVDNYAGKDDAQSEWNKKINSQHIETRMKEVIGEIILDLQERLKEFNQQYKYDHLKGIKIDLDGLEINDINEGKFGKFIKWAGVAVSAVGTVCFLFNPPLGLAATGVGILANVAADWVSKQEKRDFQKQREDLKASLLEKLEEKQRNNLKICKSLHDDLAVIVHKQTFDQVSIYIKGLLVIDAALAKSNLEIHNLKNQIKKDLSEWNHSGLSRDQEYRRSDPQSEAYRTPRRYIPIRFS